MRITEETTAQIERRLLRWMVLAGAVAALGAALLEGFRFAAGLATGAAIGILGMAWLADGMARALSMDQARMTKGLVIKLILRYPMLLGALYLFYHTKWLPAQAVLAGLFVPLAGGVTECMVQISGMVIQSRQDGRRVKRACRSQTDPS